LRTAAYKAWRTFPGVLSLDEARSYANERLSVYADPDDGSCADSGALERWEKDAGSEDQLDRYVLQALNMDLIDYGRKLIGQVKHEVSASDAAQIVEHADTVHEQWRIIHLTELLDAKGYEDWTQMKTGGYLNDCPLLRAWKLDGMTQQEIADTLGWSLAKVERKIADEKAKVRKEFYGV